MFKVIVCVLLVLIWWEGDNIVNLLKGIHDEIKKVK